MLSAIKGVYNNGHIVLEECPETTHPIEVLITFTREIGIKSKKKREFGFGKGALVHMATDFNETPYDFKEFT